MGGGVGLLRDLSGAQVVAARGRVHANLAEARDFVRGGDHTHLREGAVEKRGLFFQSAGKTKGLARRPDRIREDLAIPGLACDRYGLFELALGLSYVVEDRDGRRSPHQKTHEFGARSERPRGVDRYIELVHGREVRVEPKLHDGSERARGSKLRRGNSASGGHDERAVVQLAGRSELTARGCTGGAPREEREGTAAEIFRARGVELVGEREGSLGVVRDDLCVLLRAFARGSFEPPRVVVVHARSLGLRERRVRDVADEAVAKDECRSP